MDNNNMNTQFKDYPAKVIQDKLQQCLDYEAKYGSIPRITAIKKWCNSYEYRKNEWQWRQNVAKSINFNTDYTKPYYNEYK
jgi:hypothetical protein